MKHQKQTSKCVARLVSLHLLLLFLTVNSAFGQTPEQANKLAQAGILFDKAMQLSGQPTAESRRESLSKFAEALRLYRELGDKQQEAYCFGWLGKTYYLLDENEKALEYLNRALPAFRAIKDANGEAIILFSTGTVYFRLAEYRKALDYFNQALPILSAIGNRVEEAQTLIDVALSYLNLGEPQKALDHYNLALPILRDISDKKKEARTLNRIGLIYSSQGESQKALEYYRLALQLRQSIKDKDGEAVALNNIGEAYYLLLRDYRKALEYYNRALQIRRTVTDKDEEAKILNNIGAVYYSLGDKQKALEYYMLALPIKQSLKDDNAQGVTLNNIGQIYDKSGNKQKALEFYNKAILIFKNNPLGLRYKAQTLTSVGSVYLDLGEKQKAFNYYRQALPIFRAIGDRYGEAGILGELTELWVVSANVRLAVFFNKLSVTKYQDLRRNAQGLDNETQKTFLRQIRDYYQFLASALIMQGELEQAVQVLNLYKDEQFFDFNRSPNASGLPVSFSPREMEFATRYDEKSEKIGQVSLQMENLKRQFSNRQPSEQEAAQQKQLEAELKTATDAFSAFFADVQNAFAKPFDEKDKVPSVRDVVEMQTVLRELGRATQQKAAAIYTLIGYDEFYALLITPDDKVKVFKSTIKTAVLDDKIKRFYKLLRSPKNEPRLLGKELYDIIFKPVEAELQRTGTQTLLWSLDGSLRYVPVAALWDGEKYLVERFQNVAFTRADREQLTRRLSPQWTGFGFGSSQPQTVKATGGADKINFAALPGVTRELQSIFRTNAKNDGVLNGDVFTNAQFTQSAFYKALKQHRPLVHISSHFAFRPGDDSRSFLLLGDGTALTLSELKKQEKLFEGVELLTLSACNTAATRPDANGREIDGFAELAQRLGAGAVMASLWAVADQSTALLMSEFYRLRKENSQLTKAAALRLAQQEMLEGKLRPQSARGGRRETVEIPTAETKSPTYAYDPKKPYAHPYYWSPFVLIGNWR